VRIAALPRGDPAQRLGVTPILVSYSTKPTTEQRAGESSVVAIRFALSN